MSKTQAIVTPNETFHRIYNSCPARVQNITDIGLIGLDPGETTGVAVWDGQSILLEQWDTKDRVATFHKFRQRFGNITGLYKHLRCEDYRVYAHKADQHHFTELHTAKLIGAIEIAADNLSIPMSMMMAQQAKQFWTDEKLKLCGLYEPGLKHARDALRHLLYLICFGTKGN